METVVMDIPGARNPDWNVVKTKPSKPQSTPSGQLPPLKSSSGVQRDNSNNIFGSTSQSKESTQIYPSKSASSGTPSVVPALAQYSSSKLIAGNISSEVLANLSSKSIGASVQSGGNSYVLDDARMDIELGPSINLGGEDTSESNTHEKTRPSEQPAISAAPSGESVAFDNPVVLGPQTTANTTPALTPTAAAILTSVPSFDFPDAVLTKLDSEASSEADPNASSSSILARRQIPSLVPLETLNIKEIEHGPPPQPSVTARHAEAEEESSEDVLFNFLSMNTEALIGMNPDTWKEFSVVTRAVYNKETASSSPDQALLDILAKFKFSPDSGWDDARGKIDIPSLLQANANLYLTNKSIHQENDTAMLSSIPNIKSLSFLPNMIFTNFPAVFCGQPCSTAVPSAVLLADISGFSKFAGSKCKEGSKGLDVLHKVTSDFLGLFVRTVYVYGGDVIAFAGDALVCIFPASVVADSPNSLGNVADESETVSFESACSRAIRCAYSLREFKMNTLSAHFAISCGTIQIALLGGHNDEWTYLMNGGCISELTLCIDSAGPQQVVCTPACFDAAVQQLASAVTQETTSTGMVLISHLDEHFRGISPHTKDSTYEAVRLDRPARRAYSHIADESLLKTLVQTASMFIPKPVLNAMTAGSLHGIAELRTVTTMFLNLDSYSLKDNVDPLTLQPFFVLLQEVLVKSGGFLRQFLIDDKGCVAIAMWGVPSYTHTNDCYRGLYCAWNMLNRVSELNHKVSIGLTTGHAYCGIVGSTLRRDYAGIGDKVNIAARLMAKAKGKVLVDPEVYTVLEEKEKGMLLPYTQLQLKGMSEPITPYMFTADADLSVLRDTEEDKRSILRVEVVDKILAVLDEANAATAFFGKMAISKDADLNSTILVGEKPANDHDDSPSKVGDANQPAHSNSFHNGVSQFFGKKSSDRHMDVMNTSSKGLLPVSPPARPALNTPGGRRRQSLVAHVPVKLPDKHNRIIILTGPSGTGKSQAADFFRDSCARRKFRIITIVCNVEDEQCPFSVARKLFWEFVGKDKYPDFDRKKKYIESLVSDVYDEEEIVGVKKEDFTSYLTESLLDSEEVKKRFLGQRSVTVLSVLSSDRSDEFHDAPIVKSNQSPKGITAVADVPVTIDESNGVNFSVQELNTFFIKMIKFMLSNHPATFAVTLKKAHYCDELSWGILSEMQKYSMKLIMLVTIQQASSTPQAMPAYFNAMLGKSQKSSSARRQSLSVGSALEERGLNASVIKRTVSESRSGGQGFTTSPHYKTIIQNDRTTVIELTGLNEGEVREVLANVLKSQTLSNDLILGVLGMTSGNAFWVKSIAHFIRDFGVEAFLETLKKGTVVDALKNLIIVRLEKLTTEQQLILKHCSVIGQEFSLRTLSAVVPTHIISKTKRGLAALVEAGFIYAISDNSISLYGFHNVVTRDAIYNLLPPSDAAEIHLKAAMYIEKQFEANLSRFYPSLSDHYGAIDSEKPKAFKYTVKAADASIQKGAYRLGLDLLLKAQDMCKALDEYSLVLKVCNKGVKDIEKLNKRKLKEELEAQRLSRNVSSISNSGRIASGRGEGPGLLKSHSKSIIRAMSFLSDRFKLSPATPSGSEPVSAVTTPRVEKSPVPDTPAGLSTAVEFNDSQVSGEEPILQQYMNLLEELQSDVDILREDEEDSGSEIGDLPMGSTAVVISPTSGKGSLDGVGQSDSDKKPIVFRPAPQPKRLGRFESFMSRIDSNSVSIPDGLSRKNIDNESNASVEENEAINYQARMKGSGSIPIWICIRYLLCLPCMQAMNRLRRKQQSYAEVDRVDVANDTSSVSRIIDVVCFFPRWIGLLLWSFRTSDNQVVPLNNGFSDLPQADDEPNIDRPAYIKANVTFAGNV